MKQENKAAETTPNVRETIYLKLTAPFPDKAYAADISRADKVLTSLKAQYVVERLNEVFGLGMWKLSGDWKEVDDGVMFFGELQAQYKDGENLVTIATGPVPGFGGVDHANSGDAYKSARTDCLSKSASLLGVGNEMYKGNVEPRLSEAQKQALDRRGEEQPETESEAEEAEEQAPAKEEKPKKRGFQRLSKKTEDEPEKEAAPESDEKPQLRPARSFMRGSKLKTNRENEDNGNSSESTSNAAD